MKIIRRIRIPTIRLLAILLFTPLMLWVVATDVAPAQEQQEDAANRVKIAPTPVQIVALDECDPTTFNAALGPDFCKNVALAFAAPFATTFQNLFNEAKAGHPDTSWDFEPDKVTITKGTPLIVVNQGGEPHTFTEVAKFGGGFIAPLNHGEETVPECAGGFKVVAVARTRILQGSQLQVTGLSKGEHLFECCIHPWMRVTVEVK
jgi:plastocyanin